MLSRNNVKQREALNAKRVPHYSLRKLSIGVASVLLGTSFYFGGNVIAHAATQSQPNITEQTSVDKTNAKNQTTGEKTVTVTPQQDDQVTPKELNSEKMVQTAQPVTQSFNNGDVSLKVNQSSVELKDQNSAEVDMSFKVTNLKPGDQYTLVIDPTPAKLTGEALDPSQGNTNFTFDEKDPTNDVVKNTITGTGTVTQNLKLTYEGGLYAPQTTRKVRLYSAGSKDIYIKVLKNGQEIGEVKYTQIISPSLEKVVLNRTTPDSQSVNQLMPNTDYTWTLKINQHDGVTPGQKVAMVQPDGSMVSTNAAYDLPSPLINHGTTVIIPVPASFVLNAAKTNALNQYGITATQAGQGADVIVTIPASQNLVNDLTQITFDQQGIKIVGHFNIDQTTADQTVTASAPISVVEKIDDQGKTLTKTGPTFQDTIMKKDAVPTGNVLKQDVTGAYSPYSSSTYKDPQIPRGAAKDPETIKMWSFGFDNNSAYEFHNTTLKMTVPEGCVTTSIKVPTIDGVSQYHYVLHLAGQPDQTGVVANGGTIDTTKFGKLVRGLYLVLGTVAPGEYTSTLNGQDMEPSYGINFYGYVDHSVKIGTELKGTVTATADELKSGSVKEKTQQVVAPVMSKVKISSTPTQTSMVPGVNNAGEIYIHLNNVDRNYTASVYYVVLPINAKLNSTNANSVSAFNLSDGSVAKPEITVFKAKDGRSVVKVDYTNCGKLSDGIMSFQLANLLDVGTSEAPYQIYAYSPNNELVDGNNKEELTKVADDATTLSYVDGNRNAVYVGSGTWHTQVAKGLGLYEQSQGNTDNGLTVSGRSHDFGDKAMTYVTSVRNFQSHALQDVTTVINLPSTKDGKSGFNFRLTGPIEIVDPITLKSVSGEVTYSTDQPTLSNQPVTTGTYVATPSDWTKVRSVKVVIPSLAVGAGVRFIMNGIDPTLANDSGKTGYLSSVSWSQDWQSENGLKPYPIQVDSANAAKITVDGQKAIIKFVDQNGKEIANYPALTFQGVDGEKIPTDQITQTINTISQKKTPAGRQQYVFNQVTNSAGYASSDQEGLPSFIGSYDNDSATDQVYTVQFNEQFDTQSATLTFVDDDQNQQPIGNQQTTKGDASTAIIFANGNQELQNLINQGYEFVSAMNTTNAKDPEVLNNQPNAKFSDIQFGNYDADPEGSKSFVIHLKHGIKTVTADDDIQSGTPINTDDLHGAKYPAGVDKNSLTKTVDRTINYVYANGTPTQTAHTAHKDSLTYTATVKVDKVTGKVIGSKAWSQPKDFETITSPTIKGYTPSRTSVTNKNVAYNSDSITETVTYTPDDQKITVNYIDDTTGKKIISKTIIGKSDDKSEYTTKQQITDYQNAGYELVSDETNGQTMTFDHDDNHDQTYAVHLKHEIETVTADQDRQAGKPINANDPQGAKYPTGVDKNSLTKTVNRTINYVYANGTPAQTTHNDSLTYTATVDVDKVTGKVVPNSEKWSPNQDFKAVNTPHIKGYTADRASVTNKNVAYNSDPITETVTYNPDAQTVIVNFIDDNTGNVIKPVTLNGYTADTDSYRTTSDIQLLEAQGYALVKDGYPADGATYDNDDDVDQVYTVHLTHGTKQVQRSKQISRTINFVDRYGHQLRQSIVQTKTFTQTGTQDLVTNEIVWDPIDTQTFASLTVPVINGYQARQSMVSAAEVAFTDQDSTVNVEYDRLPSRGTATAQTGDQSMTANKPGQQADHHQQSLPQTGNDSSAAIGALGLASLIGLLGLSRKKKQN